MKFNKKELSNFSSQISAIALISLYHAGSGHPGGVLSCSDIVSYLWKMKLTYDPKNYLDQKRNRLILSKGHSVPIIYAASFKSGLLNSNDVKTLRKINSKLQGHPYVGTTPWVESSTGSLGQGFSTAIGTAMALKYKKKSNEVFVILGDGEIQEGMVWEGAMTAAKFNLNNLTAIIDYNKLQSDDTNENIMGLEPLGDKWKSFNWEVYEIDGHNFDEIHLSIKSRNSNQPKLIICHTVKGKGVSYMENIPQWHGSVALTEEQLTEALQELGFSKKDFIDLI